MNDKQHNQLIPLFTTFFKIGAFTFGGGYAMIPLIQKETSEQRGWVSNDDILEIIAIAESTPGPIAINAATFIGYKVYGLAGALCATFGLVLPSFLIILAISRVLDQFQHIRAVQFAFQGIRAGVLALICKALLSMYRQCPKHPVSYGIAAAAFFAAAFLHINVLWVIIGCATAGLLSFLWMNRQLRP